MLEFLPATADDMYDVLDIRNATRQFMTHHMDYISTLEQEQWWSTHEENGYKIWLVIYGGNSDPGDCDRYITGFCMLRTVYDSGRVYATLALYEKYRGMGIGTAIYQFLVAQNDETWIDVRNDNVASIQAALNAGFQLYATGEYISEMVYRKGFVEDENRRKVREL